MQALIGGAGSYVSAEAANVAAFTANPAQTIERDLLGLINAPTLALFGRPLIGNGASGATWITQAANVIATDVFGSPPGRPYQQRRERSSPAHRRWQPELKSLHCLR